MSYDVGKGRQELREPRPLLDGAYHYVTFMRRGSNATLTVDDFPSHHANVGKCCTIGNAYCMIIQTWFSVVFLLMNSVLCTNKSNLTSAFAEPIYTETGRVRLFTLPVPVRPEVLR